MKKSLNRVRKTTRAQLIRKLDKEFSIRVRAIGYCRAAGKDHIRCGGNLQCCHIVGRSNIHLRWKETNAQDCTNSSHEV